jgi:hypothetical protein
VKHRGNKNPLETLETLTETQRAGARQLELTKVPKRRTKPPSCYNRFCKKKNKNSGKQNLAKQKDLPENQKIQLRDISKEKKMAKGNIKKKENPVKTPSACIIASSSIIRAQRETETEIMSKGRAARC